MALRFDNRVVIVTGGGNGLGKEYCLFFGARGAKVVVNDLGGSHTGTGSSSSAAQKVVNEIKAAGGEAVANTDSVEFGEKIIQTAMDTYGRVDVVINNAGILRDISFQKMKELDWDLVMKVHLKGTYSVSRAAWNIMREQKFGRIINTASASGLYGSFGQANYSAAKLGIHGLTLTLAKEGEKRNVFTNTVCPIAASRMTETVMPAEVLEKLSPKYIIPFVAYLAHESCQENGSVFEVAGGYAAKLRWQRSEGALFDVPFTPEDVAKQWEQVTQFDKNFEYPTGSHDTINKVNENIDRMKEKAAKQVSVASTSGSGLFSEEIFGMMKVYLDRGEGKDLIGKVASTFGFIILQKKGGKPVKNYVIDLKNGQGNILVGEPKGVDATFTMVDTDFRDVCLGKLNPQNAFMTGKMKIKGNMAKATKFTPDLFPPPTPENLAKYQGAKL